LRWCLEMSVLEFPSGVSQGTNFIHFYGYRVKWSSPSITKPLRMVKIPGSEVSVYLYAPGGFNDSTGISTSTENWAAAFQIGYVKDLKLRAIEKFGLISQMLAFAGKGRAIPPREMNVYKSTQFKRLSFSYKFIPKNREEGKKVREIVNFFREICLPELRDDGYVDIPPIWDITLVRHAADFDTNKIKKLVSYYHMFILNSVDVNYSPDTVQMNYFYDGTPTVVTMTLNFDSVFPEIRHDVKIYEEEVKDF